MKDSFFFMIFTSFMFFMSFFGGFQTVIAVSFPAQV